MKVGSKDATSVASFALLFVQNYVILELSDKISSGRWWIPKCCFFTALKSDSAPGYSSCFNGALQFQAAQHKIKCGPSLTTAAVSFGTTDTGVGLSVKLSVLVEGVQPAVAFQLADLAHAFCPYSKAIDGNIEVTLDSKAVPTGTL